MLKNLPVNVGDEGSIPRWGSSPGEGDGNTLQYSCLENPMEEESGRLRPTGSQKSQSDSTTTAATLEVLFFIEIQLIYSIMFQIFGRVIQLYVYINIYFSYIPFNYGLLQNIASSLCAILCFPAARHACYCQNSQALAGTSQK